MKGRKVARETQRRGGDAKTQGKRKDAEDT